MKPEEVTASLSSEEKAAAKALEAQIKATAASRRKWGKIQALYDVGPPPRTHLLVRGNEQSPGHGSPARILASLVPVRCRGVGDVPRALRRDERAAHVAGAVADVPRVAGLRPAWRG